MLRPSLFTALCLVLVVIFAALFSPRSASSTAALRRVTTTDEQVINLNPSLSGNGRIVAFESTANLAGVSGGNGFRAIRAELSGNTAAFAQLAVSRAVAPAISRDGSRIAFASTEDLVGTNPDRNSEIFLSDGMTVSQLTNTTPSDISTRVSDGNFQPSITDDGSVVAFSSNRNLTGLNADHNLEVLTLNTNTRLITQINAFAEIAAATEAKISGDGSHVAFIRDASQGLDNTRDLILYECSSGRTVTVASNRSGLSMTYGRAISADGLRVVYSAETAPSQTQVFLFIERSGATLQLTDLSSRVDDVPLHPTISGDGKRVAFATRRNVIGGNNDRSVELYLYDNPTGQITKLTEAPASATGAVVSSLSDDGSIAAFSFPRVLSGPVSANDFANNSEIYVTTIEPRPAFGALMVFNGAAQGNEPGSGPTIAPDSIAIAKGTALASTIRQAERSVNGQFPLSLAGTAATVNGRAATILFVSPTQVTFVVPPETELGVAELLVTNSDGFQSRTNVTVVASAPGLFTLSGDGRGDGVVLDADTLLSGPFDPTGGQLRLLIFATGARGVSDLAATIAGRSVIVESMQRSRDLPGLDELHIQIPSDLRGAGKVALSIVSNNHESNVIEVTLSGSFERDILINELLADPPEGPAGDANHDGVRSSAQDEFVELVNTTARDIDLGGYQLQTQGSGGPNEILRHRFATGTVLPAGTAIVVFGGGAPDPANSMFGGARIFKASSGGLSLLNSSDTVTLRDSSSTIVTFLTYGAVSGLRGDANESLTRSPDVTGDFRLHQTAADAGGRLFSPGTKLNGTAFLSQPAISTVVVSPSSMSLAVGEESRFTARGFDQNAQELSGLIFGWQSDDIAVATVDETGLAKAVRPGRAQITASARGVHSTPAILMVTNASPTPSPSPSPGASPSPAPSPTPSPSPSPTPVPTVVISEFRTRGPGGANDEFIELHNNSDAVVDIGGWKIKGSSSAGGTTTRVTIAAAVLLPARGHFLATNSSGYSELVPGDQSYTSGIANDGGIALTLPNDAIVDQVGMSPGSAFREGMHLAPLPSDANQSYERKRDDSNGSSQDSGDNFTDFQLRIPSDPQNLSGSATPGPSPSPSPSASPSPAPTPLPSPSPSPTPMPLIVISEFRTRGPGGASDEFVELYNNSDAAIEVGGWKIKGSGNSGNPSTRLTIAATAVIPGRGHLLVTNSGGYSDSIIGDQTFVSGIANDGGIALTLPDDTMVDQVGMSPGSAFREGMHLAPLPSNANQSYERKPGGLSGNGQDTSDNFNDFQLISPSQPQNVNSNPTPGPSPSPTPSVSPSPSPGASPSPPPTPLPTPTPTPIPSPSPSPSPTPTPAIVISELRTRGPNGASDEFVELYNSSDTTINVGGWKIRASSNSGSINTRLAIAPGTVIPPRGHFLATNSGYSGLVVGDQTYPSGIANDGGIALTLPDDSIVDQVGLSAGSAFREGVHIAPLPSDADQGYERRPGGSGGSTQDTNDNFSDFQLITPSDPQNLSADPTPGPSPTPSSSPSPSPSPTPSPTPTSSPTPSPSPSTKLVISQIYGGGGNSGAPFRNDFIEIFNGGAGPVSLAGWSVQYAGATGTSWSVTVLTPVSLAPGQYYLIQESSGGGTGGSLPPANTTGVIAMAATAGKVALVKVSAALSGACPADETIVDLVGYGSNANCFRGVGPTTAPSNANAVLRKNNGCTETSNNASDFAAGAPSPRNMNAAVSPCSGAVASRIGLVNARRLWPDLFAMVNGPSP